MKILLINHYAGSPQHGMEYRPFYMASEWVRSGHEVTIVAATQAHLRSKQPEVRGMRTVTTLDGIRYLWLWTPSYQGNGLRRIANMAAFVGQLMWRAREIAAETKPDVVIASSTYPLDIVPAYRIARRAGAKLVFEVHDLWPMTPIELGGMSPRHPFIVALQWAEDFAYRQADLVISLLPGAEPHMRRRGMRPGKFRYVPNGVDPDDWQDRQGELPPEHQKTMQTLRESGRFLIGYAGSHGLANALDNVVRAAAMLRDTRASFVLMGKGPEKPRLEASAKTLGLTNLHFLPAVPRTAVPAFVSSMDAMVICWKRSALYQFGISPNKLMDYMMAGKPVIQSISAEHDIISEGRCGLTVPAENPEAICEAVRTMMGMSEQERIAMGTRGREYVTSRHNYRSLAKEFLQPLQAEA